MTALFMKIDSSSDGLIDWVLDEINMCKSHLTNFVASILQDEFCTYMLLEFSEKDDAYHRSIEVLGKIYQ